VVPPPAPAPIASNFKLETPEGIVKVPEAVKTLTTVAICFYVSCDVAIASHRESAELYTQPTYKVLLATVVVGKVIPTARNEFEVPVVQVKALAVPLSLNRKIIF
jgi:hypothetical protein